MAIRNSQNIENVGEETTGMPRKVKGCPVGIRKIIENTDAAIAYANLQQSS